MLNTGLTIAAVATLFTIISSVDGEGTDVYFPMSTVLMNMPINKKSASAFSIMPIANFQILYFLNNTVVDNYIYSVEKNNVLHMNSSSGEVFVRNDYHKLRNQQKFTITATHKSEPMKRKIRTTLELSPMKQEDFCADLSNICFWANVQYTVVEDATHLTQPPFKSIEVGTLNQAGSKMFCPSVDARYVIERGFEYFTLKGNKIYTKAPLDHEVLNVSDSGNMHVVVRCTVQSANVIISELKKSLEIKIVDRNDNGLELQTSQIYNFHLDLPHFKMNEIIGNKIIFVDKDSLMANSHFIYILHNDTNDLVRPICNSYEADHTGKRYTIISCQIIFACNGVLTDKVYCFQLEVSDKMTDAIVSTNSAFASICLHNDSNNSQTSNRPQTTKSLVPSRSHRGNSEKLLPNSSIHLGQTLTQITHSLYAKDVYVHRQAMMYSRVAQPESFVDLSIGANANLSGFAISEDRSGAFGITPIAGIIYVKDVLALKHALETVYFLNISWHNRQSRSFVMNVHLVVDKTLNTSCEYKVKSRSQTCAQIKYAALCNKFCGLATNGSTCEWRGKNTVSFSRNYASCVPSAKYCPDNTCDPLEELNAFICPQDCTPGSRIMGPCSINDNKRGILSASGTCTCGDNSKCSCAPLDDTEHWPKSKLKNDEHSEQMRQQKVTLDKLLSGGEADVENVNVRTLVCGRLCLILSITGPLLLVVLVVCLLLTQSDSIQRRFGKQLATANAHDDTDERNGDMLMMRFVRSMKLVEEDPKADREDHKWEFDCNKLILDYIIGEGEFGKVMKGYATDIANKKGVTTVAVKMLKPGANSIEYMALHSEYKLLQEVSHPNIIRLLGACTTKDDALMIIIEYARFGSLRGYLRLSRKLDIPDTDFTDGVGPVTAKDVLSFAWQICKGMNYLTDIKLVHRDLAARNVLLSEGKICKISDFGLTRDIYEDDAYLKRSKDRVPVKWMAPESLADHVYTTKTDVWAFGVLSWELITLGASPYPGVPPQSLYHLLKTGYRMEKPKFCSEEVYTIIRTCWIEDPVARPSFRHLASQFEILLGNNAKYIEVDMNAISNPSYCFDEVNCANAQTANVQDLTNNFSELDSLDHLWQPPQIGDHSIDCNSREFTGIYSTESTAQLTYDLPRAFIESVTVEQGLLHYENDLKVPHKISTSERIASIEFYKQNGSQCTVECNNCTDDPTEEYCVPMPRGRTYTPVIQRNFDEFEKNMAKTISFRFSSQGNLNG